MITIAFYKKRGTWLDRIIRFWTRGPYSHCEIVLGRCESNPEYHHTCISASWRDGGVRIKTIALVPEDWDILHVPVDENVLNWSDRHLGRPYDLLGVFGFVFPIFRPRGKKWFCSEACAAMLGFERPWAFSPSLLYLAAERMARERWRFEKAKYLVLNGVGYVPASAEQRILLASQN